MPLFLVALVSLSLVANAAVPLIIDTDMGGGGCQDVDDVAAVCVGNALADTGEAELIAVVHDTHPAECVGAISVLNHYYGRDDVPIGAYKGGDLQIATPLKYVTSMVANFPSPIQNSSQVPDAVIVYRRALASQADNSVVISSIGLLTNLAALLRSGPDEISHLKGPELVSRKVKLLAVMGGQYPQGSECNFLGGWGGMDHKTGAAASGYVFNNWPSSVRVLFSGFEVGSKVFTGRPLTSCVPANNPCRQAFAAATPIPVDPVKGRMSWDPLTTLAAVRGANAVGCVECTYCDGSNSVDGTTGRNVWISGAKSNQSYLQLQNADAAHVALDQLLCQSPRNPPVEPVPSHLPGMEPIEIGATSGAEPEMTGYGGGDFASAWDGYAYTFYDYSKGDGGWTQAALLRHSVVSAIQYFPRSGYVDRCVGGEFVGITPNGGTLVLATITSQPKQDWNTLQFSSEVVLASVQYRGPAASHGNIAEIRLYAATGPAGYTVIAA